MDGSRWVRVVDAAAQLGCHPATLRRRIRAGTLRAVRGARGRDYISAAALRQLLKQPRRGPGRPPRGPRRVSRDRMDNAWGWAIAALEHHVDDPVYSDYIVSLADGRISDPVVRRFSLAHGLALENVATARIARVIRVSERHVRRLLSRDLEWGLMVLVWRRLSREEKRRRLQDGERRMARLRARLARDGVVVHISKRYNRRMPFRPTKPRIIKPEPNRTTAAQLRDAGLSPQDIEAVFLFGLAAEELNELLIRGTRQVGRASS